MQAIGTKYLPDTFVVFDLETTGLNSETNEIIEIAAIKYIKGSNNHATVQSLIKPKRKIPAKITEITGITNEMIAQDGQELEVALKEFVEFVNGHRLVSFNAEFDMAFLNVAMEKIGMPLLKNPVSCALKMSRRAWSSRKTFRLADLARDAGIDSGEAHRALEDARRALIIYCAAVDKLKSVK